VSNAERREQKLKVGTEDVLIQVRDKTNLLTTLVSGSKELENAVRNEDDHVWKAMEWLTKNKDQFKMEVYEPMLLHLRVPDKRNSKYALLL
jgi:transposase